MNGRSGFTIIESLIVLSILAVITIVLTALLNRDQEAPAPGNPDPPRASSSATP